MDNYTGLTPKPQIPMRVWSEDRRSIPDEQESEVTVSLHMEVDQPNSTTTHTCAPVRILTEAHRDVATPSPSYTHTHTQEILAEKKRKNRLFAQ